MACTASPNATWGIGRRGYKNNGKGKLKQTAENSLNTSNSPAGSGRGGAAKPQLWSPTFKTRKVPLPFLRILPYLSPLSGCPGGDAGCGGGGGASELWKQYSVGPPILIPPGVAVDPRGEH